MVVLDPPERLIDGQKAYPCIKEDEEKNSGDDWEYQPAPLPPYHAFHEVQQSLYDDLTNVLKASRYQFAFPGGQEKQKD